MFEKRDVRKSYIYHPVLTKDYFRGKPLEIGNDVQLFLGDVMVENVYNVTYVQEHPEVKCVKPFIEAEYPWENIECPGIYPTPVIYDEDDDKFKIWYLCLGLHLHGTSGNWKDLKNGCAPGFLCYAESTDGENWVKPMFNLFPIAEYKENNIVFTGGENVFEGGRIFLNPRKDDKDKKFVMIYRDGGRPSLATSRDGIHWRENREVNPLIPVEYDTDLNVIYDDSRNVYQLFIRPSVFAKNESEPQEINDPNGNYRRSISLTESHDLVHWSPVRIVNRAPEGAKENFCDHQSTFTVGGTVVARVSRFACDDPFDWHHQMHHQYWAFGPSPYNMAFLDTDEKIPNARIGSYEVASPTFQAYPLYKDNRMYFVYSQPFYNEKYDRTMGEINYLSFGENRFVARYADANGGWMLTREFILDGTSVEINCDIAKDGYIIAEIVGGEGGRIREGVYYEGYTREDSDKITAGGYHTKLLWNGSSDLSAFKGKPIYIRFFMKNTKLYSMQVTK